MQPDQPYVQALYIQRVRHLRDVDIVIDAEQPRHLILTGPNGSGKTSLLNALHGVLWAGNLSPMGRVAQLAAYRQLRLKAAAHPQDSQAAQKLVELQTALHAAGGLAVDLHGAEDYVRLCAQGQFVLAVLAARRTSAMQQPEGPRQLQLPSASDPHSAVGTQLLQFLVNQQNKKANYSLKGDDEAVGRLEAWQQQFLARLRELFGEQELELVYDIDKFDFTIQIPGREAFRLVDSQLSDGFSAILHIVAELLMRMEAVAPGRFDVPGIAMIDEVETHLHIELQKQILPFLTSFFPNVQFIVTTHSPFVLTSLADAVCFDLSSHKRWLHIGALSATTVIEDYFESDMYSAAAAAMLEKYEKLTALATRSPAETVELANLRAQLDAVAFDDAPELAAQYSAHRLAESAG